MWYKEDLAFIHDVGFSDYALKSAPGILKILKENNIQEGLIVDLGCGSGLSAQEFVRANYQVFGVDISESMIDIARRRVPEAKFQVGSLFQTEIPPCHAVTSISECLNYLFDPNSDRKRLPYLFSRIYNALIPGGVFIFDIAEPGQVTQETTTKNFIEGKDWIVLVEKEEDREQKILTRRIITFRQVGEHYRRDDEVHRQQLYETEYVTRKLSQVGFEVQTMPNYGEYNLPSNHTAFIAKKLI
ncbi:methyltransferase type 11 [Scytonema hofmannii PCC 7110]|uniref:Methyltransferase type 11 n=1 Tax=Scytonema hofmannii PCC 7110 TaxID=128403 RepID=A0A139X682_9CYAN|nr:class I SAM-dependent methyltransferase [Scytonema hofmannii]KYC40208.1 methyltransferase type 11 [Scytonema hofmannii PCC 7110]